jgi:hypothetical protein
MVAGRINDCLTKGLNIAGEANKIVLTPENATTIQQIGELIKGGDWEFFSENNLKEYENTIRKSWHGNEITTDEWQDAVNGIKNLKSTFVKSLIGDSVQVWYRQKQKDKLSKATNYEERIEKAFNDEIEKGEITDKLAYGYGGGNNDAAFKFTKTGDELKTMLPLVIGKLTARKAIMVTQMTAFIAAACCNPTESYSSGNFKDICIMRYPWELTRTTYDELTRTEIPLTEPQIAMRSYNDMCYDLRSIMEDIATCKIILANLEDKKKYTLTVSQLVALSSGDEELIKAVNDSKKKEDVLEKGVKTKKKK